MLVDIAHSVKTPLVKYLVLASVILMTENNEQTMHQHIPVCPYQVLTTLTYSSQSHVA